MSGDPRPPGASLERTLHRDYYLRDRIFVLERERIFYREWFCAVRSWCPAATPDARAEA